MSGINIYVISLPRSQDRRENIRKEFAEKKVNFTFFDAVDGHKNDNFLAEDYNYLKALWFTTGKTPLSGEIGCYASHYNLWLKCVELNQPIIICEDDVKLHPDAANIAEYALEQVKHCGYLKLEGIPLKCQSEMVSEDKHYQVSLLSNNYGGARSYAISPQAAARLIKHRWYFPVDCFIGANYIHGQYSYHLSPSFILPVPEIFDHGSTIQVTKQEKVPFYRKPTRELYSLYKKLMLSWMYRKKLKELT